MVLFPLFWLYKLLLSQQCFLLLINQEQTLCCISGIFHCASLLNYLVEGLVQANTGGGVGCVTSVWGFLLPA